MPVTTHPAEDPGDSVIAARSAFLGYGEVVVVHDLDLDLRPADVMALLGPNGSGKSTVVRATLGLADVLGGSLTVFGTPAGRFRQRWRIGYVPQRHTMGGGLPATVTEVVMTGRLGRSPWFRLPGRSDRSAVAEAIETAGLAEKACRPVAQLSGGQQRRVLIARALASRPEVLILDEPTAGVDLPNQEILAETLRRLAAGGTTMLVVAHELGPLATLFNRTVVLRDGLKVYDGPGPPSSPQEVGDPHVHDSALRRASDRLGLTGEPR